MSKIKILYIVNVDYFILSHRLPILMEALKHGFEVHIACADTGKFKELEAFGFHMHGLSLQRKNMNILSFIKDFYEVNAIIKLVQPSVMHLLTIKPIILGGLHSFLFQQRKIVASMTGLGFVFSSNRFLIKCLRVIIKIIYRFILGRDNVNIIVQNEEDRTKILRIASANPSNVHLIKGTGIDMKNVQFKELKDQDQKIIFMASRLLKDKGVNEFLMASNLLSDRAKEITFWLAGQIDDENPESFTSKELKKLQEQYSNVIFLGQISNVLEVLEDSYIAVLPSYREGFPKFLSESASIGRPIITTDVAGCRDAVINNQTGLLVPPRNHIKLANAIEFLVDNFITAKNFSLKGRQFAEEELNLESVLSKHIEIYNSF
ncbi:glycosyltransferase family 4 protein [Gammaproteobacteria bacterium]|nr:glycosyltransferase family 4 protein [Gammaproteobacteria bacterium]